MGIHEVFRYKNSNELIEKAIDLGVDLPFHVSIDPLLKPIKIGTKIIPNRMAIQPMEGYDGNPDGSPSELTLRRYKRYAEGGSGMIWFEATSIVAEGKSNPRQLFINEKNIDTYKSLVEETRKAAKKVFGSFHDLFLVLQLTHSGRFSKPDEKPMHFITHNNLYLDKLTGEKIYIEDDYLRQLTEISVKASDLAYQAGFDAVDIKACHGYLGHELLFAYTRENSIFGGEDFENRTRFLMDVLNMVGERVPAIQRAVRLNLYDGVPYPYGFGVADNGTLEIDLTEPIRLIKNMVLSGTKIINGTLGIPKHSPHLGRPHDRPLIGTSKPNEHPMEGVARLISTVGKIQKAFPEITVVGTGYSWLRQFFPNVGAAVINKGMASIIGLGRSSFAYPDAPKDLMSKGYLDPKKVCVSCSKCTELMRNGYISGCVTRDKTIYNKEYQKIKIRN